MVFSQTTTLDGIIQEIERITLLGNGAISGNTTQLKNFTARVNQALDRFFAIALTSDGSWQFDDINYTDLPIGVTDLVSGQQDYAFASDVLSVDKILVKDSAGNWLELQPVDIHEKRLASRNIWQLPGSSGIPTSYDKFANSIFLDPIPNYNSVGGLKVVFKRNASKFVSSDTTKEPGIPSLFHPYLARVAALSHLIENGHQSTNSISVLVASDEQRIGEWFSKRDGDVKPQMRMRYRSAR